MKIYLSPSSQTENTGVGNYGTEADRMQKLSNKVKNKLVELGHTVYGSNNSLSLTKRINASNNLNVDCHVALHSNAGGGTGPEVWYHSSSTQGKKLATKIITKIENVDSCPPSRGIKATTNLVELNDTKAPAALIEVAFHDNKSDVEWMLNNMGKIANAIANGINAF